MNLGTATILRANARQIPLPDDSVDLIVTSPPYFALRSYTDGGEHYEGQIGSEPTPAEFLDALLEVTAECARVLKPTGSLWVNLGDKYSTGNSGDRNKGLNERTGNSPGRFAHERSQIRSPGIPGMQPKSLLGLPWRYAIRCIDELGLILRAEVIWSKPNPLPEPVRDRVRRAHEQWFHFTLNPHYFAAIDEVREPHTGGSHAARKDRGFSPKMVRLAETGDHGPRRSNTDPKMFDARGKLPGSVWTIASEQVAIPDEIEVDHFAAFPTEWPKRIIQGWSPPQALVLDPFGGTGTTALVAKALGRDGISIDMSADYCRLAEWRTTDRDQLAKVLGIAKPSRPHEPHDEPDLFTSHENGASA